MKKEHPKNAMSYGLQAHMLKSKFDIIMFKV